MKLVLTPRRHGVPLKPGERPMTEEERLAAIAAGRQKMTRELMRRFPMAKVVGIVGASEIVVELPDSRPELPAAIRDALDCATGPAPDEPPTGPVWTLTAPTHHEVERAYRDREYRPTVVAIIRDEAGRFLLVQSKHDPNEWMLVQGGIEPGELPVVALGREIGEEIQVGPDFYAPKGYVGCADLEAEPGRADKRGFTKGKRYFIFEVAYRGSGELDLQESELAGYAWVGPRLDDPQLLSLLAKVRPGKRELLIGAIIRVLP